MSKPYQIGVTGGIGSGKTTVCRVFEELGVPIYEADVRAKALMLNKNVRSAIINLFGVEAYTVSGINRDFIAREIFRNPEKREDINEIVHPAVSDDYEEWLQINNTSTYVVKEAALFFETGSSLMMDKMVLVIAPLEQRVRRIKQRDTFRSEDEIMNIIAVQLPDEEKIKQADYVIENGEESLLLPQVLQLHYELINQ